MSARKYRCAVAIVGVFALFACSDSEGSVSGHAGAASPQMMSPMTTGGAGSSPAAAGSAAVSGTAGSRATSGASASTSSAAGASAGNSGGAAGGGDVVLGTSGSSSGAAAPAGAGGMAGSSSGAGGAPAAGAGGGMPMTGQPDLGKGDGTDVVTIGDSWMNFFANGGGIEAGLDRAGTDYDHYAVPGTLVLNGQIPSQYDSAKRAHPKIATVILTGGGNDVMAANGCNTKEACIATTQRIIDGLDTLYGKMLADGVTSTVYISYSKYAGTAPESTRVEPLPIPKNCEGGGGKLRCVVVETTDIVGETDLVDGVHPTRDACDRIAKRTVAMMEEAGVRR